MRMSHLKVGSAADIPLDIGELDLNQLTASLTTPSGREEPCLLKVLRNGHVGKCVSNVSKEKAAEKFSLSCCQIIGLVLTLPSCQYVSVCHRNLICS